MTESNTSYDDSVRNNTGEDNAEYTAEYWRLDEEATSCFYDLVPESQGAWVPLNELSELCRRMRRPLRDANEELRLMSELDTTNQMIILRHDFITWLLQDMIQQRQLTQWSVNGPPKQQVPVAYPAWEEIVEEQEDAVGAKAVYFYNTITGESTWELPSFIKCLWDHITGVMDRQATFNEESDTQEEEGVEMLDQLHLLFTKHDDDRSGTLDITEFEDLCVAIGQSLNGREGVLALMNEVDPYSSYEVVVSWDALHAYWITNAPFQRRTRLTGCYSSWEQIDVLNQCNTPVSFRHIVTLQERWNHPAMEAKVVEVLRTLFPSSKLDWNKKVELFCDLQFQQQEGNATTIATAVHDDRKETRRWSISQVRRVLSQFDHQIGNRMHVKAAINQIQQRFGSHGQEQDEDSVTKPPTSSAWLEEACLVRWLMYCIKKVEMRGWEEVVDAATGQVYYYHEDSGETQWDPPHLMDQMSQLLTKFGGSSTTSANADSAEKKITRIFRHYDIDESGTITFDEFQRFYRALLGSNDADISNDSKIQQVFNVLDTSGDGNVSLEEFLLWWRTKLQLEEEESEESKREKKYTRWRDVATSFLENTNSLIVHSNSVIAPTSMIDDTDAHNQFFFESMLLPRLVEVLGEYQLKGIAYRLALNELVTDLDQEIALETFLHWYERFEAIEQEKKEIEAAKAKAQAELLSQEAKKKAKEQKRSKRKPQYKAGELDYDADDEAATRAKQIEALFKAFDSNGSGFLDEAELQNLVKALGHEMDRRQVHQMMQVIDMSGDNQVSLDEFTRFWNAFERKQITVSSPYKAQETTATMPLSIGSQLQLDKEHAGGVETKKRLLLMETKANLAVELEIAKERALKFSLDDFKDAISDWKDELMDKRSAQKKKQLAAVVAREEKRKRYAFIPTRKRRYAYFDVTWIEPEVVDCVVDIIRQIARETRPLMRPEAAQRIQALMRGYLAMLRVDRIICDRFQTHIDLHTQFSYYVDRQTGTIHLQRPVYRANRSSLAPFDLDDCETKSEIYHFVKKASEMDAKKRFYDRNSFAYGLATSKAAPNIMEERNRFYVPAAFYIYDVIQLVQRRILGSIWTALRAREFTLIQLIAQRHRRQLKHRSSEVAAYLPLHFVVRHADFPIQVIDTIVNGYRDGCVEVDAFGMTPLHLALREKRSSWELMDLLTRMRPLENSVIINKKIKKKSIWEMQTQCGDTPLHTAVVHGVSSEMIRWILNRNELQQSPEVVGILNSKGEAAFHVCVKQFRPCSQQAKSTILAFLRLADPNMLCCLRTKKGDLPLHLAMDGYNDWKMNNKASEHEETYSQQQHDWALLVNILITHFPHALILKRKSNGLLPIHLAIKYEMPNELVTQIFTLTMQEIQANYSPHTEQTSLDMTTIAETRMTLLHYVLLHQPSATCVVSCILEAMPHACRIQCLPNNEIPLHFAAGSQRDPNNSDIITALCNVYAHGCQIYNKKRELPLHLAITSGKSVQVIKILLQYCGAVLTNKHERDGFRALVMAANTKTPQYNVILALLDVTPSQRLTASDLKNRPVTPLYALSLRTCSKEINQHRIPEIFAEKFEQIEDEDVYFLSMAKAKMRKQHHCPNAKWEFAKIIDLMERNPSDDAVMRRSLLAINKKLQTMTEVIQMKSPHHTQKIDQQIEQQQNSIVETVTLDPELMLVRKLHQIMYEFPMNARIQLLGQAVLKKLFPTAFAKASYKAKIDPYFDL